MTRPYDPDLERGRLEAERVKAQGGDAMDQALAFIATSFDQTARDNTLRRRMERLRELQDQRPNPHRTVCVIDDMPRRHSTQFLTCGKPCCWFRGECCGCCDGAKQ